MQSIASSIWCMVGSEGNGVSMSDFTFEVIVSRESKSNVETIGTSPRRAINHR